MAFKSDSKETARQTMLAFNPDLAEKYAQLIEFLALEPGTASALRGRNSPLVGSSQYIQLQAIAFSESRKLRAPQPPATVPDEMVSVILNEYFDVPTEGLIRAKKEHLLSMGAESLVGELLERYLATILEPRGWIWCSGSLVRAVDFIKPPAGSDTRYTLLQVKNRDNSENSSSSAIRLGTSIEKWHRTFSKKAGANWAAFPEASVRSLVSEEDFTAYVRSYLKEVKNQ